MVVKEGKSGISLISLIITIIVVIILAAVVIFSGMDTPEKAQLSKVISDIDNVQTAVDQAYYGLYTEKAVAGEVWTQSQFYEAVATGKTNREDLTATGLVEISENSLVDINLPVYEGRKWYMAVTDVSDTVKTGSVVLSPGFESQGKTYATLLDVQNGGSSNDVTNNIGDDSNEAFAVVEPTNSGDWEWIVQDDGTLRITKYKGNDAEVIIPNRIDGVKVTAVGNTEAGQSIWADNICEQVSPKPNVPALVLPAPKNISKITVSYGVESILDYSFMTTINAKNIVLPSSVTSIGFYTFGFCTNLESITMPNSATSIDSYAFYDCTNLKSITIPNGVTNIGDHAFCGCTSLASVTIPNSVTSIDGSAFSNISSSAQIRCQAETKPSGWVENWTDCDNIEWNVSM